MNSKPALHRYATDTETRDFVKSLSDDDLAYWENQQTLGSTHAQLDDDRASHAHGAEIAIAEIQRRT